MNTKIVAFQELIDKYKNLGYLYVLLQNEKFFKELIENNTLTQEDLKYLLNKIGNRREVDELCSNTSLIKHILNEFVLNETIAIDKFNKWLERDDWYKKFGYTRFDLIDDKYKNVEKADDQELLELNNLNKRVYKFKFEKTQKLELVNILKDNEISQNRLKQLIETDSLGIFDFESLKQYLSRNEKKTILSV